MNKMNCWEFMHCERQPGGAKVGELGVCPATLHEGFNGAHGGIAAGRVCWLVVGSFCGGKIQGTFAEKYKDCTKCAFMALVQKEESLTVLGFSLTMDEIRKERKENTGRNKT